MPRSDTHTFVLEGSGTAADATRVAVKIIAEKWSEIVPVYVRHRPRGVRGLLEALRAMWGGFYHFPNCKNRYADG